MRFKKLLAWFKTCSQSLNNYPPGSQTYSRESKVICAMIKNCPRGSTIYWQGSKIVRTVWNIVCGFKDVCMVQTNSSREKKYTRFIKYSIVQNKC
jgi:hypothetical protein